MKIVIECASALEAKKLKSQIVDDVKNEELETWEYKKGPSSGNDLIFHNPSQFVKEPEKNVLFVISTEGNKVILNTTYWTQNPKPSREMNSLHTGRLVEVILGRRYSDNFHVIG